MAVKSLATLLTIPLLLTSVSAHAFFHTGLVNGKSQGHLFGVRAPQSNSPIQDVNSDAIVCNSGLHQPVSTDVIEIQPGDTFGMQWNHNLAGPTPGDGDDPIAASHKGPVMAYMARVDDAASNTGSGLKWFKVAEEGFDTTTRKWGVDTLIENKGLWSFKVPSLAPGDYLLRGEIIALHSAGSTGEAQFYMSCVGIRVTGSGTCSPSDTVNFPGAYKASDPGILISIYSGTGKPDNDGKPYTIPGPPVVSCGSAPSPSKPVSPSSSTTGRPTSSGSGSGSVSVSARPTTKANVASSSTTTMTTASPISTTTSKSARPTTSQTRSTTSTPSHTTTSKPTSQTTFTTQTRTTKPPQDTSTTSTTTSSTSTSPAPTTTDSEFHPWGAWFNQIPRPTNAEYATRRHNFDFGSRFGNN